MSPFSRRTFLELASASVICGCSNAGNLAGTTYYPILAFSDLHFDPFYDPSKFSELDAADPSQWASIFATSAITTASIPGADTNYPLLVLALASIRQNLGASPFILYTGDLLGHGISQHYIQHTGSSDAVAILGFSNKTLTFVTQQIRAAVGDLPIFFAVGNCDSYTGYGPDSVFLANSADTYYTQLLNSSINQQDFQAAFTAGGYYSAEPAGTNLMVIGLNTIQFSPLVQNKDGSENNIAAVTTELDWFDAKLAAAKADGKKVWLLMHAPPGADIGTTAQSVQSSGHLASATMMWEPNYQDTFMQILAKYPGVITMSLAGHTHMDEYRIMSAGNVIDITPGISPCFKNDPAYKVFRMDNASLTPTDYSSLHYDLTTMPSQFSSYYTYSQAYSLDGHLGHTQENLYRRLISSAASQALYRKYYYSGNDTASPITNTNWPVYCSGIEYMEAQDLTNAVNAYTGS
jgi:sphingomyelin phosphodiesterase acid-like 3